MRFSASNRSHDSLYSFMLSVTVMHLSPYSATSFINFFSRFSQSRRASSAVFSRDCSTEEGKEWGRGGRERVGK